MSITTSDSAYNQGNAHFVDEEYDKALECYTEAIELEDTRVEFYEKRAAVYQQLEDYQNALNDSNKAIQLKPSSNSYLRKGYGI